MTLSAKRCVSKEVARDRYVSMRPWLPKRAKFELTMIRIDYAVIDGDGDRLQCSTWSMGTTAKVALRKWLNRRPPPASADFEWTILVEPLAGTPQLERVGDKVEVRDTLMEYMKATA